MGSRAYVGESAGGACQPPLGGGGARNPTSIFEFPTIQKEVACSIVRSNKDDRQFNTGRDIGLCIATGSLNVFNPRMHLFFVVRNQFIIPIFGTALPPKKKRKKKKERKGCNCVCVWLGLNVSGSYCLFAFTLHHHSRVEEYGDGGRRGKRRKR